MRKCENCKKYDDCLNGSGLWQPCGAYSPKIPELSPEEVLAKAKAEGRLVVLPCKVGDTVYVIIDSVDMPYVRQEKVIAIEFWNKNSAITLFIRTPYGLFEFGKTVFLTREAAEKALGGGESD